VGKKAMRIANPYQPVETPETAGVRNATLDQIARSAGLSKTSFQLVKDTLTYEEYLVAVPIGTRLDLLPRLPAVYYSSHATPHTLCIRIPKYQARHWAWWQLGLGLVCSSAMIALVVLG